MLMIFFQFEYFSINIESLSLFGNMVLKCQIQQFLYQDYRSTFSLCAMQTRYNIFTIDKDKCSLVDTSAASDDDRLQGQQRTTGCSAPRVATLFRTAPVVFAATTFSLLKQKNCSSKYTFVMVLIKSLSLGSN